ncbi:uncharacterized protein LOC135822941 [Sycon ciliatum]|uniref:uncharacterized protein LOC135822941 n=1 Tax=Sycon ciliatum TaxID=27933 RepID=UPI0031F7173C
MMMPAFKLSTSSRVLIVALLSLLCVDVSSALICHCNDASICGSSATTCSVANDGKAACLTHVYDNGTQFTLLCSAAGSECPRAGDPVGDEGTYTLCCRSNLCNDGEVNVMTAPHAPEPINVPPRSEGKLRCDCQVHDCKDDAATGKRKKAHCVVRDGWCATKTRVNPLSAIFGRNLPPQTIRYCTTDYSECSAGFQGDSNVLCCSNRRFCNEGLSPSLSAGDLHRIPTDPRDNPKVSPITTQPPREDPTEVRRVWCHCTNPVQCNETFPFCQTSGECQYKPSMVRGLKPIMQCVEPKNFHLCVPGAPCCTEHCCNGQGLCKPISTSTDEGPTTQHPEYDCHCHNCIQNYRCPSRHGCFFRYNNVTKETEQDCLRDEHSALVSCTPTFSRTRHLTEYSRVVGDVHFYCCRGHNCNEKHPAFPDVVGQKRLVCACSGERCTQAIDICATTLDGGHCYSGSEGQFCLGPDDHEGEHLRLCSGNATCCNSNFCNKNATSGPSIVATTSPSQSTTRLPITTSTSQETSNSGSRVTNKYESLFISVSISIAMVMCVAIIVVVMVCKHQKSAKEARQQRLSKYRRKPPINLPTSTFDAMPVMHQLSAWQHQQMQASLSIDSADCQPLQSGGGAGAATANRSASTTSTLMTDTGGNGSQSTTEGSPPHTVDNRHSSALSAQETCSPEQPQRDCYSPADRQQSPSPHSQPAVTNYAGHDVEAADDSML